MSHRHASYNDLYPQTVNTESPLIFRGIVSVVDRKGDTCRGELHIIECPFATGSSTLRILVDTRLDPFKTLQVTVIISMHFE